MFCHTSHGQQEQRWHQQQHHNVQIQQRNHQLLDYGDGDVGDDNPAADTDSVVAPPVSIDEQIKAYEALQAEHARQAELMQFYQQQELLEQQRRHLLNFNIAHNSNDFTTRRRRKNVIFAEDALLYGSDRTEEDVQRMWYNKAELNFFKEERREIVRVLKKSNFNLVAMEASGKYCLRGYEPYFSMEVNRAMKYARTLVVNQVLAEQERQRTQGYSCCESIRVASDAASLWARENALQLGKNDEIEVFCYYQDDEEEQRLLQEQQQQLLHFQQLQDQEMAIEPELFHRQHTHQQGMPPMCPRQDFSCESHLPHDRNEAQYVSGETQQDHQPCMDVERSAVEHHDQQDPTTNADDHDDDDYMQEEDPLAERLESALKLVQALKYGRTS